MSSFGSSVINKSNKRLAPKARIQRRLPNSGTPIPQQEIAAHAPEQETPLPILAHDSEDHVDIAEARPQSTDSYSRTLVRQEDTNRPRKRRKVVVNAAAGSPDERTKRKGSENGTPERGHEAAGGKQDLTKKLHARAQIHINEAPQGGIERTASELQSIFEARSSGPPPPLEPEPALNKSKRKRRPPTSLIEGSVNAHDIEPLATRRTERSRKLESRKDGRAGNPRATGNQGPFRASRRRQPGAQQQATAGFATTMVASQNDDAAEGTSEDPTTNHEIDNTTNEEENQSAAPPRKRRKRKSTPEGAEQYEINPETMTMYDLCKDSRKGKKSRLESEFQEVDWTEVTRRRKEAEARARVGETNLATESNGGPTQIDRSQETAPKGPQLKLVNGQIVVDTSSLVVDRHAGARPDEAQPAVEERDITRRVNSQSWMNDNRRDPRDRYRLSNKSDPWSAEATEQFYSALRMFGTDFMMISKMFPGRTRRHIKLKFVREERAAPAKIKEALVGGSIPMDLQTYCKATGQRAEDYKDPDALEEELKAEEERQRTEIEKQKEEQAEAQRKKQEAAAAKAAAGRQRKLGEKGSGKTRKKKPNMSTQNIRDGSPRVIAADDAVVETIEVQNGVPVVG